MARHAGRGEPPRISDRYSYQITVPLCGLSLYLWGQALAGACGRRLEGRHPYVTYYYIHTEGVRPRPANGGAVAYKVGACTACAGIHLFYTGMSHYAASLTKTAKTIKGKSQQCTHNSPALVQLRYPPIGRYLT